MSVPAFTGPTGHPLLVVIDPAARRADGESVRIARDVLCAGAPVKVCLPQTPEEVARALARRGQRRPVVVGDDRAMLRAVQLLHREHGLTDCPLSVVPVGGEAAVAVARSLGVPTSAVAAARAVLGGVEQRLDLLVDDRGGVVLGTLRITAGRGVTVPRTATTADEARWWAPLRAWQSFVRTVRPASVSAPQRIPRPGPEPPPGEQRLRVEVDGVLLADCDRAVEQVSVSAEGGLADVVVRPRASCDPVRAQAHAVTVSGAHFQYRPGTTEAGGPVQARTWTVLPAALRLTVPAAPGDTRPPTR